MSLTSALEAALDLALRDADAVSDDVLLSRDLKSVAEDIFRRHGAEPVRLHRVSLDLPRPTKMAVAGDPGHETPGGSPHVVRGTAVEMYVAVDGATTMAHAIGDDEDLLHAGVTVDVEKGRIVVRYAAEHPLANAANRHFDESLRYIESQLEIVNKQVAEFNQSLEPAIRSELEHCKAHAEERKKFASALKLPESYERWWGRP
jgi:DNA-directed RNA polymerase subunit L